MSNYEERHRYIWRRNDELGRGATATVYKARQKITGEVVAAKVFANTRSSGYDRGRKEFDVLKRLKHVNIVSFLNVEDQVGRDYVLIMEYCAGGSLHDVLEAPENAFGLAEDEFLTLVRDISSGIKYLRQENIVHRDIKPANIMIAIDKNGSSIFKVSDFDVARTLDDKDCFQSLCGTEEYVHPDIYEVAILHSPRNRSFTAKVDLWSLGCTFYHAATGRVPFRPHGGRRNSTVMCDMTSNLPMKAIGACADELDVIQYEFQLPDTCRLTDGLQELVLSMLQGLIEVNEKYQMEFEDLFRLVGNISNCHVLHIFSATHCTVFTVYSSPTDTLSQFQDNLARKTGLHAAAQRIFHKGTPLRSLVTETDHLHAYPGTTQTQPYVLLSDEEVDQGLCYSKPKIPLFPKVCGLRFDARKDYEIAKQCLSLLYLFKRCATTILLHAELLETSAEMYTHTVRVETEKVQSEFSFFLGELTEHSEHLKSFEMMYTYHQQLQLPVNFSEEIKRSRSKTDQVLENSIKCKEHLDALVERLAEAKQSLHNGKSFVQNIRTLKAPEKLQQLIDNTEKLLPELKNDSGCSEVISAAKTLHVFNMQSLAKNCEKAKHIVESETVADIDRAFHLFLSWFSVAQKQTKKALQLNKNVSWSIGRKKKISENFLQLRQDYETGVRAQLWMKTTATTDSTSNAPSAMPFRFISDSLFESNFASSQTSPVDTTHQSDVSSVPTCALNTSNLSHSQILTGDAQTVPANDLQKSDFLKLEVSQPQARNEAQGNFYDAEDMPTGPGQ